MKLRLIGELHAGAIAIWNRFDELTAEAEFLREFRVLLQRFAFVRPAVVLQRDVEIARHPFECAADMFRAHDVVNLIDGDRASFPKCFATVLAELLDDLMQTKIGDHREMGSRMTGVGGSATSALDQSHACSGFFQKISGRNPGETATHDGDININVVVNRWESGPIL